MREAGGVKPRRREEQGTARYEAENEDSLSLFFYVTIPSYFLFGAGSTQEEEPDRGSFSFSGVALASHWTERVRLCPTQLCCGCWSIPQLPPPLLHTNLAGGVRDLNPTPRLAGLCSKLPSLERGREMRTHSGLYSPLLTQYSASASVDL